jgi:hypothetical protein
LYEVNSSWFGAPFLHQHSCRIQNSNFKCENDHKHKPESIHVPNTHSVLQQSGVEYHCTQMKILTLS